MAQFKPAKKPVESQSAKQLHNSVLIIDTHADTTQRLLDDNFDMANPPAGDQGNFDFAKAKTGNLGAEFFSIWVEPKEFKGQYAHRTLALIDSVYQQATKHPDKMMMAFSTIDIERAHREHKLAALMGIEGGHSIENDLGLLRDYYRLGVRYMTLTWSNTNEWADSSGDINDTSVQHHNGLTEFGKDVVYEMNRLGMMVDISHVSDKTFYDALLASRAPLIASHSSARALTNHPRNMTDDMLRELGRRGGVVMVNYYSAFVDENWRQAYEAQSKERTAAIDAVAQQYKDADPVTRYRETDKVAKQWAAKIPRPPFEAIIDHIDHVAKIAGVDHTGLGSDFDGTPSMPQGLDSAADLPKITEGLLKRGYTAEQIRKILGGNLMRVFTEVEAISRKLKAEERPSLARQMSASK
ncbi:MAG: membrane dipeptidase [Acidobacteria bacterium]|nr:MAG: membrane dipeptidase [Acidobacteriota bacterium]PYY00397.1 MAG: membrane dipeptidase [Acidobacteriota bacterium]PYY22489.1 MAG: membrane dipeptidase [Acidobacteriota bacterium]